MGHVSQIAYSYAKNSLKHTVCLDGDGSFLMHMGGATSIGEFKNTPLVHVVLNNGAHLSVGGQPTIAKKINLTEVAKACGFTTAFTITSLTELEEAIARIKKSTSPVFLNILVSKDSFDHLLRPDERPIDLKMQFMDN